jgi:hypothetical protein
MPLDLQRPGRRRERIAAAVVADASAVIAMLKGEEIGAFDPEHLVGSARMDRVAAFTAKKDPRSARPS